MKHFRVAHRLRRRLRIVSPVLARHAERCYLLEILLRKQPAVREVSVVVDIGSLTVRFDPDTLPEARLLATLDAILGHLQAAPPPAPVAPPPADAPLSECSLSVEGMTCASCALLIEMKLRRDPRVREANVNFAAASVNVRGAIDRAGVTEVIRRLGYAAQPMDTLAQRRQVIAREQARIAEARRRSLRSALLSAPVVLSGMLMHRSPALRLIEFALSSAVLFGSGGEIFRKAWQLARQGEANMDTLIAIGAGAAWGYSLPEIGRASCRERV